MPFDGGLVIKTRPRSLGDMLESLNIKPVDPEVLGAHKRAQIAANPPSWIYHHQFLVGMAQGMIAIILIALVFTEVGYSIHFGHPSDRKSVV